MRLKVKSAVELICGTCGKPVSDRPRSNVTRWLFQVSRCNCVGTESLALVEKEKQRDLETESFPNLQVSSDLNRLAETIGEKYEVISVIGHGGMGTVYKVKDTDLDRIFALKVLKSSFITDQCSVKRFEQEARAASNLTHSNLCAVYDFGIGKRGTPFLLMDYLEGRTLAQVIETESSLDVPRAIEILIQIAEAIEHAHQKGVVHRDIKPGNIILKRTEYDTEHVKVIDFGISKLLPTWSGKTQNLTQEEEISGSPPYMSPEQCLGQKVDARSDIYAIGCVMYEALTGRPPFEGRNPIQTILKHIRNQPEPFSAFKQQNVIPEALEQIVMRCLEKDPAKRYQSAADLVADLKLVSEGKLPKWSRGRKRKLPFPALMLCTAAVVVAALISSKVYSTPHAVSTSGKQSEIKIDPLLFADIDEKDNSFTESERLSELGMKYFQSGQYGKAISALKDAIRIIEKTNKQYKIKNIQLAEDYELVGRCYLQLGSYIEAMAHYTKAIELFKSYRGPYQRSPFGLSYFGNWDYASLLRKLGKIFEAEELSREIDHPPS